MPDTCSPNAGQRIRTRGFRRKRPRALLPIAAALVQVCACGGAAQAQEAPPRQWQFFLTPYLWLSGVSGTLTTPNPRIPDQEVDAGFSDLLSHLNSVPIMGAAEVRYGRFGLLTDIMVISVKSDIKTDNGLFSGGSARLTQVIGSALGAYRVIDDPLHALDLGVGVRAFGISTRFTADAGTLPGFTTRPGQSWADAIVGIRYHVSFGPRWALTAYADAGGGPSASVTWQLLGTLDYRLSPSTALRVGYRHLQFEYEGSRLHQNMRMSGPIIGATFQF